MDFVGNQYPMSREYRIALVCGFTPLFVGIALFLIWLNTHWDWLISAGILTPFMGCFAFALGVIGLAISPESRRARPLMACALLLCSPMAMAIVLVCAAM